MSNLIDRQALIAKLQAYYGHDNRSPYGGRSADAIAALSSIEGADTVDAELVRHGKWLDFVGDYTFAECSVCGEVYDPSDHDDKEHFDMFKQLYRFCPACGAKMDGGAYLEIADMLAQLHRGELPPIPEDCPSDSMTSSAGDE